jgi:hypothetical protein
VSPSAAGNIAAVPGQIDRHHPEVFSGVRGSAIVPIRCEAKQKQGFDFCRSHCVVREHRDVLQFHRVSPDEAFPEARRDTLDVVILDMHHRWPNLGYDSIRYAFRDSICDLAETLEASGLGVRVLTFDVRHDLMVPEHEPGRFSLYVGTGGPGHLDPRRNDGIDPVAQGVKENAAWLRPYGRLLDAITDDPSAAYIAICHSFGLLCSHMGAAVPTLRGPEKGGKSSGIVEVLLTDSAEAHPWFGKLRNTSPDGRVRIMDSRFYDLIPTGKSSNGHPAGTVLGVETVGPGGPAGDAVTLVEFARDAEGVMPRVYGTNFHPETAGRERYRLILEEKWASGGVTEEWYRERAAILRDTMADIRTDEYVSLASDYTFLGPLRFHLYRAIRQRLAELGSARAGEVHENRVVESPAS